MKRMLLAVLLAWFAMGPVRAQDRVTYLDHTTGKEVDLTGTIDKESPAGITLKVKEGKTFKEIDIPALDVRQVTYKNNLVNALEYRTPFGKERIALQPSTKADKRKEDLALALKGFQDLAVQLKGVPNARRYMEFKIAEVTAEQSRDDPARLDAALAALNSFKNEHHKGWEIVPALRLLAKLQEDKGDAEAAGKTYEELAAVPGVPKEIKEQSDILVARLYLRGGKHAEAARKLEALRKSMAADDPQKAFLDVYLAQCQMAQGNLSQVEAQLSKALANSSDPSLRALAHNFLGDYYRLKNQFEDAFWHYLKVDTLYSQDKEEHAKALYYLGTLFDKVKNDPIRAAECREKLKGKEYAGTTYQRQGEGEKKP